MEATTFMCAECQYELLIEKNVTEVVHLENEYKKNFEKINFKNINEFKKMMKEIEKGILKDFIEKFEKREKEAKILLEKYELWDMVKNNPLILHKSSTELALIILTNEKDIEAINKFNGRNQDNN